MQVEVAFVHTVGGGVVTAVDERIEWFRREGSGVSPILVAPEKRRNPIEREGFFFPTTRDLPDCYDPEYEETLVPEALEGLREAYRKKPFQILDAHDSVALIAGSIFACEQELRVFHTVHSHEIVDRQNANPSPLLETALKNTERFIAVSDYIASCHHGYLPKEPTIIRNPVPNGVRARNCGEAGTKVKAIFVGRVETDKGVDVLLDALDMIGSLKNFQLTILGQPTNDDLVRRAGTIGISVCLRGPTSNREELFDILSQHDLFIFPTRKEACSMALLEALGTGLAVIASDIQPNLEIAGDSAIFHQDGDPANLAKYLASVVNDPCKLVRLSEQAMTRAEDFKNRVVFQHLEKVYTSRSTQNKIG